MTDDDRQDPQAPVVLGQRYAYATASLLLGIACFVSLLGIEKAILAVTFGYLALKSRPYPRLGTRRWWAKVGVTLGVVMIATVTTMLILFFDRFRELIEALEKLW